MKPFLILFVAAAAAFAGGCADPKGPPAPPDVTAEPTAADALKKPMPTSAADDPRVVQARTAADAVTRALATIRERLAAHRASYDQKVAAETDLRTVVTRLLPLATAAREDCDAIHRAVLDLRIEMRYAQAGYESAAQLYRQRADAYTDPDLRAVTAGMAAEFARLAAAVPGRRAVLNKFHWKLCEVGLFLADTERCLRETDAALAILTAGPDPAVLSVSDHSKAFRKQLEQFIAVTEEYRAKLLNPAAPPAPATDADPGPPEPPAEPAPPRPPVERPVPPLAPKVDAPPIPPVVPKVDVPPMPPARQPLPETPGPCATAVPPETLPPPKSAANRSEPPPPGAPVGPVTPPPSRITFIFLNDSSAGTGHVPPPSERGRVNR